MTGSNYLVEEAIAVRVAMLAGLVASRRLNRDIKGTNRCYGSSCQERLCEKSHVDDCEDRCSRGKDPTTCLSPWLLYAHQIAMSIHPELGTEALDLP